MPQILQHRRNITSAIAPQVGTVGEIIIDTDKNTVVVMDGVTAGGFPLAKESDIPLKVSDLENDQGYITAAGAFSGDYDDLTNKPTLFTGAYDDLTNKPTLFTGAYDDLSGKPTLFTGDYDDLANKPTIFSGNYNDLSNKPNLTIYQLANSAFSGAYDDLTGAPNLSTYQLTVDAFNGNYNDLANLPTIPTDVSELTDTEGLLGGGGAFGDVNQLISDADNNTFSIANTGDVVFSGELGGVNRGLVWDYGANTGGVNSMVRQDNYGLTIRAWTETDEIGIYGAPVNIVTNQDDNQKTWSFDADGVLALPQGGAITETEVTGNPAVMIVPAQPSANSQVLLIKGGAPGYSNFENGIGVNTEFNQYSVGDTISINVFTIDYASTTLFWWLDGVDQVTPTSGEVVINEFGGSDFPIEVEVLTNSPFRIYVGPVDGDTSTASFTVSINGDVITDYHLHLTTGDLTETSIILGTDDHNVRTTVNGAIEITTPNETNNVWRFGTYGDLELPVNGGIVFDRANTTIRVGMGFHIASGEGVSIEAIDETDPENLIYKNWYFGPDGSITFPDSSVQITAGAGDRVVSAPTTSKGATGDQTGSLAYTSTHHYYCVADYVDGVADIWVRSAWDETTWS